MVIEVAILKVKEGLETQFEADFKKASSYISSVKGYKSHSLKRCIEKKSQYILLVDWETLEDHTLGFRKSEVYQKWKALLHHYYEPFPEVEHYKTVI